MTRKTKSTARSDCGTEIADAQGHQLGWYVGNCARSPLAVTLESVILSRLERLQGGRVEDGDALDPALESEWEQELEEARTPQAAGDATEGGVSRARQRRALRAVLRKYTVPAVSDERIEVNAGFAREQFGFDDLEAEILRLLLRYECNPELQAFADAVLLRLRSPADAVAALLAMERPAVRARLSPGGRLIDSGLICLKEDEFHPLNDELAGRSGCIQLAPPLRRGMYRDCPSADQWGAALLGDPQTTPLAWEDFAHLGGIMDLAAEMLTGAITTKAAGINVLLHGPVGTGKTEFAKVLAARVGPRIWSVGETDEEDGEPSRSERLAALRLAQRLLEKSRGGILLFDEAEDVLASETEGIPQYPGRGLDGSKVYLNRLIERNPVPVIWACNDVSDLHPAVLRRMTLVIEVKTPGRTARRGIWQRVLRETGLDLPPPALERLADQHAVPAALAANAARVAKLTGKGEAAVEQAICGVAQLLGIAPSTRERGGTDFDPALVHCEVDLVELSNRLALPETSRRWSLCVSGPPGTGKSEFVRYLAGRMGLEVMPQRASDLLSMWVGGSEKNIAGAFQAARARRAMLVIDEADSLLSERREALRSWEVTQVNEMLTWMETHPLPFVCTTNLMERLDQASLRRFTLKLKFKPLRPSQAAIAFERFFGTASPCQLPDGLTAGDFATVRRKQRLLAIDDPALLAAWLAEELDAKGTQRRPIGFVTASN